MADRVALGAIGYLFGGVTALVMLIGATVLNASLVDPSNVAPGYAKNTLGYEVALSAKSASKSH